MKTTDFKPNNWRRQINRLHYLKYLIFRKNHTLPNQVWILCFRCRKLRIENRGNEYIKLTVINVFFLVFVNKFVQTPPMSIEF